MPRDNATRHGSYHIDQRGRVVERRVGYLTQRGKNCSRCMYCTPIGNELVCRKTELPTEVRPCYGNSRFFIEVSDENEEA